MTDPAAPTVRDSRPPLVGVALISFAVLALQVSLTRVFSLLIWYHFAFLAVALALLGFTAGGVLAQCRPDWRARDPSALLSRLSLAFSVASAVALLVAAHLPFRQSILASPGQFACFVILVVLFLVPFVCAGLAISLALAWWAARAARVYFADLSGSSLGCLCVVFAMDHFGGGAGGVLVGSLAAALASAAFARRRVVALCVAAVTVGLIALAREPLREPFYLPNAKIFPRVERSQIIARRCTSLACVDFFRNPLHLGAWGIAPRYGGAVPEQIGVVIDAWALTSIFHAQRATDGSAVLNHPVFAALPPSFAHLLNRVRGTTPGSMLIIGAGGGVDVRAALTFGVRRIEAVDINDTIIDAVSTRFADYAGNLYARPDVHVTVSEGRHYLRRSPHRYDLIQISGVDTYAASQAGAFALSENYLYTVEALREDLEHLAPHGTLTMTRWLYQPPRQTLRLCVIADAAYRAMGLGDLAQRVVIIGAPLALSEIQFSVVLMRREPFAPDELAAVRLLAGLAGYNVVYAPDGAGPSNAFTRYFASSDRERFVREYPFRIDATTDDQPFFFEHYRFSRLLQSRDAVFGAASGQLVLLVTLLVVLGAALVLIGLPAWYLRRRGSAHTPPLPWRWRTYFVALGLGFIAVEMAFVPRFTLFLGHPVYALSVVLFTMLLASALGSALAPRWIATRASRLAYTAAGVALVIVVERTALAPIFALGLRADFIARVAITAALVGMPAIAMGTLFPGALARAPRAGDRSAWITQAWVLNGYASVLSTVAAMLLAMAAGFGAVLIAAAGCYAVASGMMWREARTTSVAAKS